MRPVLTFLVLAAMVTTAGANPKSKRVDWNARAKAVTWSLDPDTTVLDYARNVSGYDVVMVHGGGSGGFGDLGLRIESNGTVIYAWAGHEETPLLVDGDVLYYSAHSPISDGATIVAVDLKTGTEKWRTALQGIGPISHSKYRNRVKLELDNDVVIVQGEESSGSYVELVDRKTGKSLADDVRNPPP